MRSPVLYEKPCRSSRLRERRNLNRNDFLLIHIRLVYYPVLSLKSANIITGFVAGDNNIYRKNKHPQMRYTPIYIICKVLFMNKMKYGSSKPRVPYKVKNKLKHTPLSHSHETTPFSVARYDASLAIKTSLS